MKIKYLNILTGITFLWIGFVCAISFMEAWLKFQAPGIDIKLGLGIGKLVFTALNYVEITLGLITLLTLVIISVKNKMNFFPIGITLVFIIILVQSIWLLPYLNERADRLINNISVPHSSIHIWYVLLEVIKVFCLFLFGSRLFKARLKF